MEIQEMIDVLMAYRDGKQVEFRYKKPKYGSWSQEWKLIRRPAWNFDLFEYRVKE